MILSLSAEAITLVLDRLLIGRTGSLRAELEKFAADNGIEL
jgi:hypothetical protein